MLKKLFSWPLFLVAGGIVTLRAPAACAAEGSPRASLVPLYVATDGNDTWSGGLAAPNADRSDGPFATLTRARNALRAIDRKARTTPLVVMVRGGKYFLDDTFVIGPRDGGTVDAPVIYTAYSGEKPVLSGGRRVAGWRPYKGKIVQVEVPAGAGGKFRQLFYHGRLQIRARTPNFDPQNPYAGGWAKMLGPGAPKSEISFRFDPADLPHHWAKPTEAEVNFFLGANWGNNIIPVKSIDAEKRVITLAHGATCFSKPLPMLPYTFPAVWLEEFQDNVLAFHRGQRFFVENVLEELDQPGEWCRDSQGGRLYFWPPDEAPSPSDVVIPVLDGLIALRGAAHVALSGLTFTETNGGDNIFRDGIDGVGTYYPTPGWKYCGEAVRLQAAERCRIEGNRFMNLGGNAVYLEGACVRNAVCGNEIADVGACGVVMGGAGAHYPMFNEIVDNYIRHPGVINRHSDGIYLGLSEGNAIGHNRIERVPQHAINLGNAGRSRNIVEYNELRDTCLECADTGALNCWMEPEPRDGSRQGHIIRYNLIVGSRDRGIYLDNYTSNCHVYGNVVAGAKTAAIFVHGGRNNVIENNIFADCGSALVAGVWIDQFMPAMAGFLSGNRFTQSIVFGCRGTVEVFDVPAARALSQADENVFFNTAGAARYLERQRRTGLELHSVLADPKFRDPTKGDYRLEPDSPALELGFTPTNMRRIGPQTKPQDSTRRIP